MVVVWSEKNFKKYLDTNFFSTTNNIFVDAMGFSLKKKNKILYHFIMKSNWMKIDSGMFAENDKQKALMTYSSQNTYVPDCSISAK